jgi:hypothetical protein
MKLLNYVNSIRDEIKTIGNYMAISKQSGVNYHWLTKFAQGSIKNPTLINIHKLEKFITNNNSKNDS